MKIAVIGKKQDTINYVRYITAAGAVPLVSLSPEALSSCGALLLPGGGDITPAFFGECNHGSCNIDTELDIRQLQAFELALSQHKPVLGICKGMQIINVGLGGKIIQDLPPEASLRHRYDHGDKYHNSVIKNPSWLYSLYGEQAIVNSAHHQSVGSLGSGLEVIQYCSEDGCAEAVSHETLPVIGVQWHPERIDIRRSGIDGKKILAFFLSLVRQSVS